MKIAHNGLKYAAIAITVLCAIPAHGNIFDLGDAFKRALNKAVPKESVQHSTVKDAYNLSKWQGTRTGQGSTPPVAGQGNTTGTGQQPATGSPAPTQTQTTPPPAQTAPPGQGLVSNVFTGTDIREALSEIASSGNATVIPDESIKATPVFIEFRNEPFEQALSKLALMVGAYWKKLPDNVYLLSQANPESSLFREFSVTRNYIPQNQSAATIQALLPPNFKPFVQADVKTNIMTITAPAQSADRIVADLEKIDAPSRQFIVEALVTQLNKGNDLDFGFSWSWKNFAVGDDLSLNYAKAGFDDVAKMKALITDRKATLRANPRVSAFEGRETTLTVGQDTYYSILTGNIQFPTAQIQLIHTGVTLKFTGYVAADNTITLVLEPEVSDAVVTVNGNPSTNVRRVTTTVRVKPGETIAIGGLIQETTSNRVSRVPILGWIPLIGELFSQHSKVNDRQETIILITPHLTDEGVGFSGIDSGRRLPPP